MKGKEVRVILTMDGRQYAVAVDKATGKMRKLSNSAKDMTHAMSASTIAQRKNVVASKALVGGMSSAGRQARVLGKDVKNTRLQFDFMKRDIVTLRNSLGVIGFGLLTREIIQAGIQMERLNNQMLAATGSTTLAANEMVFVRNESDRLGLSLSNQIGLYARLTAASKGTELQGKSTRDIFSAISETATVLQLSAQDTEGAIRAIEQMMSKGNVQAEELRGQLGERIPGAFQIAARAMNVTTQELNKMLDGGKVLASDLLPAMAEELRKTFGDNLSVAVNSATANINRFETQLFDLKVEMSENLLPIFSDGIRLTGEFAGGIVLLGEKIGLWERNLNKLSLAQLSVELDDVNQKFKEQSDLLNKTSAGPATAQINRSINETLEKRTDIVKRIIELQQRQKQLEQGSANPAAVSTGGEGQNKSASDLFDSVNSKLKKQIELYGQTTQAAAVRYETEKGALKGLLPGQKEALILQAEQLDKLKAQTAVLKEQTEVATIYHEQHTQGLENNIEQWRVLEQNAVVYDDKIKELDDSVHSLDSTAQELGFTFSSAFEDAIIEGEGFRDVLGGIFKDMQRIILRKTVTEPFGNFVSDAITGDEGGFGFIKNLFSGGASTSSVSSGLGSGLGANFPIAHDGGVPGAGENSGTRFVSPRVFDNAPRFHDGRVPGLKSGELPAIIKDDEGVFTPAQMKALGGSNINITQHFEISGGVGDEGVSPEVLAKVGKQFEGMMKGIAQKEIFNSTRNGSGNRL